jgi:hypothetical protein
MRPCPQKDPQFCLAIGNARRYDCGCACFKEMPLSADCNGRCQRGLSISQLTGPNHGYKQGAADCG